jgi:hypothetical protein
MKKKFFAAFVVAVVAAIAGYNMSQGQDDVQLTDVQMENVEALANVPTMCPNGCHSNGPGCSCNGFHAKWREHVWPED